MCLSVIHTRKSTISQKIFPDTGKLQCDMAEIFNEQPNCPLPKKIKVIEIILQLKYSNKDGKII